MPNVNVDLLVAQGSLNKAEAAQSIGTDGCTFCVGVVAVMADTSKYCAHFDCNSNGSTQAQKTAIQAATLAALMAGIGSVAPARLETCTTSNTAHGSTGAIVAGIVQFFPGAAQHSANGIYSDAAGNIQTVNGSNEVTGNAAEANEIARITIP